MENITSHEMTVLRCLREKLSGSDADLLGNVLNGTLKANDIQRLCEIINDEYLMTGIEEDYSPNKYGQDLENLLNKLNAPRLS